MKKRLVIFSIASTLTILVPSLNMKSVFASSEISYFNNLSKEKLIQYNMDFLNYLLYPTISNSINNHYGKNSRRFDEFKIVKIEKNPSHALYSITVEFTTFATLGPHIPPIDQNIATYEIIEYIPNLKIQEISYSSIPLDN